MEQKLVVIDSKEMIQMQINFTVPPDNKSL